MCHPRLFALVSLPSGSFMTNTRRTQASRTCSPRRPSSSCGSNSTQGTSAMRPFCVQLHHFYWGRGGRDPYPSQFIFFLSAFFSRMLNTISLILCSECVVIWCGQVLDDTLYAVPAQQSERQLHRQNRYISAQLVRLYPCGLNRAHRTRHRRCDLNRALSLHPER